MTSSISPPRRRCHEAQPSVPSYVERTMNAAAEGIKDRLVKDGLVLHTSCVQYRELHRRRAAHSADPVQPVGQRVGFSPPGAPSSSPPNDGLTPSCFRSRTMAQASHFEVQDRVFNWFESHPLGSRHRGAGLGLSIVRSFVELHGGTVTLDSAVGHGTTVVCTFPIDSRSNGRRPRTIVCHCPARGAPAENRHAPHHGRRIEFHGSAAERASAGTARGRYRGGPSSRTIW